LTSSSATFGIVLVVQLDAILGRTTKVIGAPGVPLILTSTQSLCRIGDASRSMSSFGLAASVPCLVLIDRAGEVGEVGGVVLAGDLDPVARMQVAEGGVRLDLLPATGSRR